MRTSRFLQEPAPTVGGDPKLQASGYGEPDHIGRLKASHESRRVLHDQTFRNAPSEDIDMHQHNNLDLRSIKTDNIRKEPLRDDTVDQF